MDYGLVLLVGALTVCFMIKHHIKFNSNDVENNEIESVDWGNGKI